jgi:hypothetical protein
MAILECFLKSWHLMGDGYGFKASELEIFLEIVGQGYHQYVFVCLGHASTIDFFHIEEVDQGAQDGFYRAGSYLTYFSRVLGLVAQLLMDPTSP